MKVLKEITQEFFSNLQDSLCQSIGDVDGKEQFREDLWTHPEGGGGKTRVIEHGAVFEKGGVNFSAVSSTMTESLAAKMNVQEQKIFATGISVVLHPLSPMIPTVHLNLRYLELESGDAWFGGGIDLTPWYLFEDDVQQFHQTLKHCCDKYNPAFYPKFKKWCDDYFFLRHREEARGVGGIFFDYVRENLQQFFPFVQDVGKIFLDAYLPIVERRRNEPWGVHEKQWQLIRRGRYVEFNLLYDRGTLFGLETKGRIESILLSLPPEVKWQYTPQPPRNSREAQLIEVLRHPKEWA
jgi:coproporphyrinogen III oxidase